MRLASVLLLVGILFLTIQSSSSGELKAVLKLGEELNAQGKYGEAINAYREELNINKNKKEREILQKEIGEIYFSKLQDYQNATTEYLKLIELYPKSKEGDFYNFRLGLAYEQLGEWTKAAEAYQNIPIKFKKSKYETLALDGVERCFKKVFKDYVAVVNGNPITRMEFEDELASIPPFYKAQFETDEGKEKFLDQLIERRLLMAEAEKRNVGSDPAVLQKLKDARMRILISTLVEEERKKAEVSERELKEYYDSHIKDEFKVAEQFRARQIVVKTEEEAKEIMKELQAGVKFDTLAVQKSIDAATSKKGGDMGFITKGSREKAVDRALFGLRTGDISDPVQVEEGYAIFKVEERKEAEGKKPVQLHLRQIVTKTLEEAKTLADTLKKGADFATLAKEKSIDKKSKKKGGDIGFISKWPKDKKLERMLFGLKIGELSDIVKISTGFALLKLEEMKPETARPFDEVKERIKNNLLRKKQDKRVEDFLASLKNNAKIEKHLKPPEEEKKPAEEGKKEELLEKKQE